MKEYRSVREVYSLPPSLLLGAGYAPKVHPLDRVVALDDSPKLILTYDHHPKIRVIDDLDDERNDPLCTHLGVWFLLGKGEAPQCFGFNPLCLADGIVNGVINRVYPERKKEAEDVFGVLKGLSPLQIANHPSLMHGLDAAPTDERWRVGDTFISIAVTDRQMRGALAMKDQWVTQPRQYQARAINGENCKTFVKSIVVEGAGVKMPAWWTVRPWPGMDVRAIKLRSHGQLTRGNIFPPEYLLLQPGRITRQMNTRALRNLGHG